MTLVRDFESGKLDVPRLDYAIITLIPKEQDTREMRKFRPISLANCSFKIITKAMTNRIVPIHDRIVTKNQTVFIRGRFILESVAREMRKFRPISLANCSSKIITEAMTNRIVPIRDRIIAKNQTVFIRGRFILESGVCS
jgi:hypothetical protein